MEKISVWVKKLYQAFAKSISCAIYQCSIETITFNIRIQLCIQIGMFVIKVCHIFCIRNQLPISKFSKPYIALLLSI